MYVACNIYNIFLINELIHAHLTKVNHVISYSFIIKKIVLLNVFIQEDAKI